MPLRGKHRQKLKIPAPRSFTTFGEALNNYSQLFFDGKRRCARVGGECGVRSAESGKGRGERTNGRIGEENGWKMEGWYGP
jgi:hypothetical protein